jgi:hypothetical protein
VSPRCDQLILANKAVIRKKNWKKGWRRRPIVTALEVPFSPLVFL